MKVDTENKKLSFCFLFIQVLIFSSCLTLFGLHLCCSGWDFGAKTNFFSFSFCLSFFCYFLPFQIFSLHWTFGGLASVVCIEKLSFCETFILRFSSELRIVFSLISVIQNLHVWK